MKIPRDLVERKMFYDDLTAQCTVSRVERFNFYCQLRNYYLFGTIDQNGAPYNKIAATVETLSSLIYSPDNTRFSLHLGTEAGYEDRFKAIPLAKELTEQWRISRTHRIFGMVVKWSFVYGAMLIKCHWENTRVRSYIVEPHQFGVLREDILPITDQEAFTHHYTITKSQLYASLEGNPRREAIMAAVSRGNDETGRGMNQGLTRLLIGASSIVTPGSIAVNQGGSVGVDGGLNSAGRGSSYSYAPKVQTELIDMCDLYVWNDDIGEYQLATRASPDVTIYDRPASQVAHVKGIPPFIVVRPEENLYDYFWGDAFIAKLAWMQDWRSRRVRQVDKILDKQADPPMSFTGGVGIAEEKLQALRSAGGQVSFPTPTAKTQSHAPEMPADIFAEIHQIDEQFADAAGLGNIIQGRGESGVRSKGQADLMARLGSSRPKERATAIEEAAEECARLILRTTQDHSKQRFTAEIPDGKPLEFIAEQFTRDYEVKVDAHSSSPVFVEDRKKDANELFEHKAIDRETLLEMYDPPNLQDLKERLKVIEKQEAAARKEELAAEAQGQKRSARK